MAEVSYAAADIPMDFDLSDEQKMLQGEARRMFADCCTYAHLRSLIERGDTWDPAVFQSMAEVGFLGAAIPEINGGAGLGEIELCVLSEEIGRTVAPIPFSSSICGAAEAIRLAGSAAQKSAWLPLLSNGTAVGTVALDATHNVLTNRSHGEYTQITGRTAPMSDAPLARVAVVAIRSDQEVDLFLVDLLQDQVRRTPLVGFDQLRQYATIEFDAARAERLPGGRSLHSSLVDRLAVYTAFEQIGGAESCLTMARDYVMQRRIFNRELGSYQAVKHKLADIWSEIELARSNAYFAAWALSTGSAELPVAAAAARLSAIAAYELASRENLHLHGGIGYTWETNCHFHYRRSRLLTQSIGGPDIWSDRLIDMLRRTDTPAAA